MPDLCPERRHLLHGNRVGPGQGAPSFLRDPPLLPPFRLSTPNTSVVLAADQEADAAVGILLDVGDVHWVPATQLRAA